MTSIEQGNWETKTCPVHGTFEGSHEWCPFMEPYVALAAPPPQRSVEEHRAAWQKSYRTVLEGEHWEESNNTCALCGEAWPCYYKRLEDRAIVAEQRAERLREALIAARDWWTLGHESCERCMQKRGSHADGCSGPLIDAALAADEVRDE